MWCVAVVAAAVSAVAEGQGQIVSYDGTIFVNDNTQPEVIVQAPSSAPVPATTFARSFVFAPPPAPVPAAQPAVFVQAPTSFPTFVPPLQPTFGPVAAPVAPQFGIPQGGLPVLPACPSTYSLVSAAC